MEMSCTAFGYTGGLLVAPVAAVAAAAGGSVSGGGNGGGSGSVSGGCDSSGGYEESAAALIFCEPLPVARCVKSTRDGRRTAVPTEERQARLAHDAAGDDDSSCSEKATGDGGRLTPRRKKNCPR